MDGQEPVGSTAVPGTEAPDSSPIAIEQIELGESDLIDAYNKYTREAQDKRSSPLRRYDSAVRAEKIASLAAQHSDKNSMAWYERLGPAIALRSRVADDIKEAAPKICGAHKKKSRLAHQKASD